MINLKAFNLKKPTEFYIYLIENPREQLYIGATTNIDERTAAYSRASCSTIKNQVGLTRSILTYGWTNHKLTILEKYSSADFSTDIHTKMVLTEQKYINYYYYVLNKELLNSNIQGQKSLTDLSLTSYYKGDYIKDTNTGVRKNKKGSTPDTTSTDIELTDTDKKI